MTNGTITVCGRGCELLTRSLHCEDSKSEADSSGTGRFQIADQDGGTLNILASQDRCEVPLSGRNSQFAILKARWDQMCEGMGQLVLLIGDEGMGKTRMVRELVSHAAENSSSGARTIVWNCRPFQQGQSLHPLLHWLRHSHEEFGDLDGTKTISTRIDTLLECAETSISEPGCVLRSELGVRDSSYRLRTSLSATQRREQSCQVLIDWLKGQAKESPLLLVIEDLQWVAPATLSFLTVLAEGGFTDRIMTLLTFRSDFETPWGSRAHQTQVALNRLTKRHAKTMIEAASGRQDVSAELVDQVLKRTDGVPLYIEAEVTNPASNLFNEVRSISSQETELMNQSNENNPSEETPEKAEVADKTGSGGHDATVDFPVQSETSMNSFGETIVTSGRAGDSGNDGTDTGSNSGEAASVGDVEQIGKYKIRGILGQGAFGVVYRGFDPQLDREVAIKVPITKGEKSSNEALLQEFQQEARNLAKLNHTGIVTVHDVSVDDGVCYIVSEFLEGPDLNEWLQANTLSWQDAASLIAQVADALAYAHSQSTVHRDLKPGNIILTQQAGAVRPVLVDFGLALTDGQVAGSQLGVIAGTPNYMSPEQARGEGHRIDGRTDIYALGVILYRLVSGELPFVGSNLSVLLTQIIEEDPRPPRQLNRSLPRDLERICLKAMARDIADRYTTATDLAADLRQIVQSSQQEAKTDDTKQRHRGAPVKRQVTVLNCECELFESSEFIEDLDPEEQHDLLQEYQDLCRAAVEKYDGSIIQASGSELMVCFGYPTAYEDAAQRAVRTGLELISQIKLLQSKLEKEHDLSFAAWAGVHTGPAVLQEDDKGDLSLTGAARTIASHLDRVSEDDAVVITDATNRLV